MVFTDDYTAYISNLLTLLNGTCTICMFPVRGIFPHPKADLIIPSCSANNGSNHGTLEEEACSYMSSLLCNLWAAKLSCVIDPVDDEVGENKG